MNPYQQTQLSRLAFFSKHRERVLRKFNGTTITYDVKIAFLDQHSMKLGNNIFYDLESKRQNYITSFEILPASTVFFGMIFLTIYAIRTPLTSKLYKELLYSTLMGAGVSYSYVHQQKRHYHQFVDEIYEKLKDKFATNPILSTMKEDEQIIKNFGFSKYSDNDDMEDEEDPNSEGIRELGLFEGNPNDEKNEYRSRILNHFYG